MVDYSSIPRDSRRVPLATKVQFKFDRFSGFISEYSANISPTGMYIVSSAPEPPGRILELEFRMGDGFEIIQGRGEVVWSRSVGDGPLRPPGMGIRFLEMSEGSKDLIYRIVDRYVQEGGVPFDLTSARDRNDEAPEAAAPAPAALPERRASLENPASLEETVDAFPDLPPLDLEPAPFPDLDLDPVKDSSGVPLPWFSAAPGQEAPALDSLPPALPGLTADPALRDEEPFELFPSIGPALEEVEQTFAGTAAGRNLPREEPPAPLSPAAPPPAAQTPTPPPPAATATVIPPPLVFPSPVPAPVRAEAPLAPIPPVSQQATTEILTPLAAEEAFPPLAPPTAAPALFDPFAAFEPVAASPPPEPPPSGPGLFADYLPKTPKPTSAPARRPVASLAGGAAAQEPRRVTPWVLLGLLVVLGAAAFLLRDRIPGWLGLGGDDEGAVIAQNPRPALPQRRETPSPDLGSDLTAELEAAAAASSQASQASPPPPAPTAAAALPPARPEPTPTPPAPLPEAVQRKPAGPAPAPAAGPAATAVERITFEKSLGGTDIVLWGNGGFPPASYTSSRMGSPPRALIVVTGIRRPFPQPKITVGTGEAKQVRIGHHGGDELHVVIDLAAPDVKVSGIDQDGQRLRIHLQKGS